MEFGEKGLAVLFTQCVADENQMFPTWAIAVCAVAAFLIGGIIIVVIFVRKAHQSQDTPVKMGW